MLGRDVAEVRRHGVTSFGEEHRAARRPRPVLEAAEPDPPARARRVSRRRSRRGEVVGLAGLLGSGRTETAKAIFGAQPLDAGTVIDGAAGALRRGSTRAAIAAGIAMLPEDRKAEGIVPDLSVRENIVARRPARAGPGRAVLRSAPTSDASPSSSSTACASRPPAPTRRSPSSPAATSRRCCWPACCASRPTAALLDDPTRGIDVGRQGRGPGARSTTWPARAWPSCSSPPTSRRWSRARTGRRAPRRRRRRRARRRRVNEDRIVELIAQARAEPHAGAATMAEARRDRRPAARRDCCSAGCGTTASTSASWRSGRLQPGLQNQLPATVGNLRLQLVQVVPVAIVALGMALVIGTEGIDLSVGSMMAVAAAADAALPRLRPLAGHRDRPARRRRWSGVVNGDAGRASSGIQPIVATLGMLVAGRGIALVIAEGRLTELFDPTLAGRRAPTASPGSRSPCWSRGVPSAGRSSGSRRRGAPPSAASVLADRRQPRRASALAGLPVQAHADRRLRRLRRCWPRWPGSSTRPAWGPPTRRSSATAHRAERHHRRGGRRHARSPAAGSASSGTLAGALLMQLIAATLIRTTCPTRRPGWSPAAIIVAAVYIAARAG